MSVKELNEKLIESAKGHLKNAGMRVETVLLCGDTECYKVVDEAGETVAVVRDEFDLCSIRDAVIYMQGKR